MAWGWARGVGEGRGIGGSGVLGILLDPGLSGMLPGHKEEVGQEEAVCLRVLITTLVEASRLGHLI